MESNKNSMLFGMIEERYGTRLPGFSGLGRNNSDGQIRSSDSPTSSGRGKPKRKSVLNTLKKMVKFDNSSVAKKTEGSRKSKDPFQSKSDGEVNELRGGCGNLGWWEPPQESSPVEFCRDTSLHGLKYIGQSERHFTERIFWFLTFAIGLSVAIWLISEMWTKYKMNPVIVSFQPFETNVDQVPFPAVTVCNMNKVMRSKAQEYIRDSEAGDEQAKKDMYYLNHVCTSTQSFSRRFNFTQEGQFASPERDDAENLTRVNQFLRKAAQNCTEMIRLCVWHDQEIDCSDIFRPIETEFGKCCTFNMIPLSLLFTKRNDSRETAEEIRQWEQWDIDKDGLLLESTNGPEFPRRQMKAGLTNGLSFLLNVDSSEYYCTSSDSVGFRMATHLSLELPKIADFGISLRPQSEIFVDVLPQITMVDPDIFSFPLDKRLCYKTGEYKLTHYKYYSVNNCVDECIANDTKRVCGCKRYYMPRNGREPLCGPQKFDCAEDVRYMKTKNGIRNTCSMCFQSCTEVNYEPQTTSTPLMKGIWKFENGTDPNWKEDDLSIVHVYIGQDSFYAKVRKELYGPTDLFANTGGLMGLCLGFSGLSVIEVIYFLTLRAWWKSKRKKPIVLEDDSSKWATKASITPTLSSSFYSTFKRKTDDRDKDEQGKPSSSGYYRSIFGEIRVAENKH